MAGTMPGIYNAWLLLRTCTQIDSGGNFSDLNNLPHGLRWEESSMTIGLEHFGSEMIDMCCFSSPCREAM